MSTLTPREQVLFDRAKASLPSVLFSEDESANEVLAAFSKQFAVVWDECEIRLRDTFIATASSNALNQHARDRGTRRQNGESDEALTIRLRFGDDAVTPNALITIATNGLVADGVTIPPGYPALVELRRDRAFYTINANTSRHVAYFSRGYRMAGAGRGASAVVVILPYGTSQSTADSIAEALRLKKAGGVTVIVERRLNP